MLKVTWFRHNHEHRNDWLRFGFMRRARVGQIKYSERFWGDRVQYGFEKEPTEQPLKANSLIVIECDGLRRRCVIDSNDSFYVMNHLIGHTDLYFCAGYNSKFFRERRAPAPLAWQDEEDCAVYIRRATELIENLGEHFERARPFIPIAPNLATQAPPSPYWKQKGRNVIHKMKIWASNAIPWSAALNDFESRYSQLLSLRGQPCQHDVVLLDTLWGWPSHRVALHQRLFELSRDGHDIRSRLSWHEPSSWDGSASRPLDHSQFPLVAGAAVKNYESMLAKSRLAPFATGFHYGWRNIMTLALMIGTPVLSDRIILEPWFGFDRFKIDFNDDFDWACINSTLLGMDNHHRTLVAKHNTAAFDEVMTPEATADYVIRSAVGA